MGKIGFFNDLETKKALFNQSDPAYYTIDQAWQFVDWYNNMKASSEGHLYNNFFRGTNEARYKLYNSSQRYWIQNNLTQLESLKEPIPYIKMVQNMVNKAKENKLLRQVFDYYDIKDEQMDFPLLSILQHYNAPTPLMDWTYDIDIALFFAIDNMKRSELEGSIENYISVYRIEKGMHNDYVMNNLNYISANIFPSLTGLSNYLGNNRVVYISDFEIPEIQNLPGNGERKIKPLTTYYNLNILAQKGIFIFNPDEARPLEEFAMLHQANNADNRIFCYNINKDLVELIRLKIGANGINQLYIYPDMKQFSGGILSDYLQWVVNS